LLGALTIAKGTRRFLKAVHMHHSLEFAAVFLHLKKISSQVFDLDVQMRKFKWLCLDFHGII